MNKSHINNDKHKRKNKNFADRTLIPNIDLINKDKRTQSEL